MLSVDAKLPTELQQVNLSGVDFLKRDLSRHNLTGANLSGCNLSSSVLIGANLTGAKLEGKFLFCVAIRSFCCRRQAADRVAASELERRRFLEA